MSYISIEDRINPLEQAIEDAIDHVSDVANSIMVEYLNTLREKYPNHHFRYRSGMGVRSIKVYNSRFEIADICCMGITWKNCMGWCSTRSSPLDDIYKFILEFECMCNSNVWFDAEDEPAPDFVAIKLEKLHGKPK